MKTPTLYQAGIWLLFHIASVICTVDLTMKITAPSPITVGKTQTLNIRCSFDGQGRDVPLEFIKLTSKKVSGNTKTLAQITEAGSAPSITDADLRSRSEVNGALYSEPTASSYLQLKINNVSCVEATTYTCSSQYQNTTGPQLLEASAVVEGRSEPTELEYILTPIKNKYPINSDVKMTCTGKVGKPVKEWFWFKYNPEKKLWMPITNNIVQSDPAQVSDCAFSRHSNYTFTLPDDEIHKFRCTVDHDVKDSVFITLKADDVSVKMKITAPSPITVGVTQNLNIRCSFDGQGRDVPLEFFKLTSKKASGNTKTLAQITEFGSTPSISDADLRSRSEVTGSLYKGPTATSYLQLKINNVSCVEATTYMCSSQYQNTTGPQLLEASAVVEGKSEPTELEYILTPIKNKYPRNSEVKMTCTGKVGKPIKEWFWFRYNPEKKLWLPYTNNIVQSDPAQVSDCAFSRHSNCTFTLPDDEIHKFRCTVDHDVNDSVFITLNADDVSGANSVKNSVAMVISSVLMAVLWNQGR